MSKHAKIIWMLFFILGVSANTCLLAIGGYELAQRDYVGGAVPILIGTVFQIFFMREYTLRVK